MKSVDASAVNFQPLEKMASAEDCYNQLIAQIATPGRNDQLIAALEKLAEQNPLRAIELARSQANRQLRSQLLDAAFRGWGKTDANAAAAWILNQPVGTLDQNAAIASVLKSAVQDPDGAVKLAQWLNIQNPEQSRGYGDALIYAFAQAGNFQRAADFAANSDAPSHTEWLTAAYSSWANYQPQNAAASALQLADAGSRQDALNAVISGWGPVDPEGLANFAVNNLAEGDQKNHALSDALVYWAGQDPAAAAQWINTFNPAPEFDSGEAAIATQPDVMKQPSVAIDWAGNILDPNLRSRTIAVIVETWALSNPALALNFVQTSNDLSPEDRAGLLSKITPQ